MLQEMFLPRLLDGVKEYIIESRRTMLKAKAVKASQVLSELPFIEKIILFGSVASGSPTRKSDVDLYIVVDEKDENMNELCDSLSKKINNALADANIAVGHYPGGVGYFICAEDKYETFMEGLKSGDPRIREYYKDIVESLPEGITLFERNASIGISTQETH